MDYETFRFEYPRVLSIAGSDSGGGAGIQADLKTFSALGCYGMTAITALTAQNTRGVRAIHDVPPTMLRDQIDAVIEDIGAHAVKIGMLHAPEIVNVVADAIDRHSLRNVVLDPVMVASSGATLIETPAIEALKRELFPRADVLTPNLDEASLLTGRPLRTVDDLESAATLLLEQGARAVLLKGGHLPGEIVVDLLMTEAGDQYRMESPRVHSANMHGTGCTLSSAIAAWLALGKPLPEAVRHARNYVHQALRAGAPVRTGAGGGPLDHGYAPENMRLRPLPEPGDEATA
ncbi:MAG: bifunctional hydroxymethylpyrimidine kinase/phosphomethylpyrimidine kinase [Candidatus Accumulibacter sp.]|jgi:hydroxymethylpyrimidine/phosphomethylpyrimidine kinase|nr:bifunctional hydroxymethylpyrimidine kinase/phosphomethylpyrimidine kinase [Accumulibacter sp.]